MSPNLVTVALIFFKIICCSMAKWLTEWLGDDV